MESSNIPYVLEESSAKPKRFWMELTPRRHELLSTYLLGIGTLFLYTGYSLQQFIGESVIHSIHEKSPDTISAYAGYYGAAFHLSAFAVFSLITPSLQHFVPSKWFLTLASALFAVYYLGFFQLNKYYFYLTQALMGVGYSFYNNGEGQYLSEHSSRRTIESNTGIETAVGHASMFFGGIALIVLCFLLHTDGGTGIEYSDLQIRFIYGTMFILNIFSVIVFAFLPTKQYDSIASKSSTVVPSFANQIKQLLKAFQSTNLLILMPFFFFQGFAVSFLMTVYPTTLSFTHAFKTDIYIIGIYSVSMGLAEAIGGIFLRPLLKRAGDYGLYVTAGFNFLSYSVVIILAFLSIPNLSTFGPTSSPPIFLTPSRLLVFIIGFLIGFSDFCVTMARAVICQVAVPDCRMQVFSLSKLYQSGSSVVVLLLTPYMTIYIWLCVLTIFLLIGTTCFVIVARRTAADRQKHSIAHPSQAQLADKI
ncbi:UNC93-like protein MFSD11 [Caenorhabditis elegans]|uniref:UNC93-like protein MFSD11 n=2 Tax=Caenorhabditis elegans TaxID=6239 RepID=Q9XWR7_CAEEL|nr:UNC93-like protein MFSD11 [Caenorhabditis elegans]CAA21581.1 UNC93-like protein MFSD11 [Caenorhabditis elegans]|eukprot:NP_001041017.1 Uncharacterized protein CELE_Y11D7A.3 [Caenorhabditis elegans]